MASTILLVRHASTNHLGHRLSGRMADVPLSASGRAEAATVARLLAGRGVERVLHSPVQRAAETAAAAAAACGVAPERADALTEIDFGGWTGRTFAELDNDADWRRWNAERGTARPPGGESMAEVRARMGDLLGEVAATGGTAVLVSHADVIRAVVADVLGLPLDRLLAFDVDPASVTTVAAGPGWARLVRLNEVAPLPYGGPDTEGGQR